MNKKLNNLLSFLKKKITKKDIKIGIIGLGYTGLPLAIQIRKKGFVIFGFDVDKKKISNLKKGISYIDRIKNIDLRKFSKKLFSSNFKNIQYCDVIIICVPTPLKGKNEPNLDFIKNTIQDIIPHLKKGQILILESTSYPGTTRELIVNKLKKKFNIGKDFFIGFSSERINPGFNENKLDKIPKVVSGYSKNCLNIISFFYKKIFDQIVKAKNLEIAEFSKLLENIYRSVNISFINEMKIIADKMNLDIFEILNIAQTKPFGFKRFNPGPGTGGHCIPIDPEYMFWKAKKIGFEARFIRLAANINIQMTNFIYKKIKDILKKNKIKISNSKILVIGIAYKKNIDDLRESASLRLISLLLNKTRAIDFHDKLIKNKILTRNFNFNKKSIILNKKKLSSYDIVIIMTDHDYLNYEMIKKYSKNIIDCRGKFNLSKNIFRG
ncbi:nucleotide sugar dehydrogenase [Candidatus Pelagibacter sp.]|nr:nucleotide sugar dehydrogenase [Candidatus Pelagibacter sp.]